MMESVVAKGLKGRETTKTAPFDVIVDDALAAVEVKTVQVSPTGRIFTRKSACALKREYVERKGLKMFTVAIDLRGVEPVYYVREGIGSFWLRNMRQMVSLHAIRCYLLKSSVNPSPADS